jgi:hypothetical protein
MAPDSGSLYLYLTILATPPSYYGIEPFGSVSATTWATAGGAYSMYAQLTPVTDPTTRNVLLNWTDSATIGITSQNIWRCDTSLSGCTVLTVGSSPYASVAGTATTYADMGAVIGKTYLYAVTAVDPNGQSAYSNVVTVPITAPPPPMVAPAPPTNLMITLH